jgi:hypothetical protein
MLKAQAGKTRPLARLTTGAAVGVQEAEEVVDT